MFDEEYHSLEKQAIRIAEARELQQLEDRYRNEHKLPEFNIGPCWHLNKSDINFNNLPDGVPLFLKDSDFMIYWITLVELKNKMWHSQWLKGELYYAPHNGDNYKITRILKNWESKISLIPVILNVLPESILIQDGNHRLRVCDFLSCARLPVIVGKTMTANFLKMVDNAQIEIIG